MKRRGGGSLFKRGNVWWVKYYRNGQPMRESSGSALEGDAKKLLNKRMGAIATGQPIAPRAEKVVVDELLDDLVTEYEVNGRRSLRRLKLSVSHLRSYFGAYRAQSLDVAEIRSYIGKRQADKMSNATINRELAALKRAYTLACQARKILTRPHIPGLTESNPREGFFERAQLDAVCRHLPPDIQPVARFAYITGWRLSEVIGLTWKQIDFHAGTVRLEPGTTKNKAGRTFPFLPELRALLDAQREHAKEIGSKTGRIIPFVFHRRGKGIKSFYGSWRTACGEAGVPGRIFHDFRRTAVRNLERAGVPRSVAMQMVGHKTEAIYRRYAIVSESDLRAAADKLHESSGPHSRTGTITGTVAKIERG